jgi:NAD(P)-dependent dehydrogenase (short-subunit alcohol dehydrogenase family)
MASLFALGDRVVVVTGGLGQLGQQFSASLVAHGARVAILDAATQRALTLPGLAEAQEQDRLVVLRADTTSRDSLLEARRIIEARWGPIFGLVNNAALDSPPDAPAAENGPFETYPETSFDRVMTVNVKGCVLCCQVFGATMAARGEGSIVNVASIYGMVSPDQSIYDFRRLTGEAFFKPVAYSVSKSALYNLTRYVAAYWGHRNVRANTVTFAGVFNDQDPRFLDSYLPKVPLGRMAQVGDYNGAIVFLMSDASAYMTGSNMVLDGGYTAL